ncbi:MAG TPA: PepSY domain-containing protein [Steroidobacteraceae bacterium]|jgi:uncharacterized iron-regulated membrane protein|nr:PepSY domain-containing protein [Steroidobacteraceae bacterium]
MRAAAILRGTVLVHRYLGIGVGVLMALWCLSGIVMIYRPYPRLAETERLAALAPLSWRNCCTVDPPEEGAAADAPIQSFELEMLGPVPVLRLLHSDGRFEMVDLASGRRVGAVEQSLTWSAAAHFGASRGLSLKDASHATLDHDQWTVALARADRPFHKITFDDPQRTVAYFSSRTGKLVQVTTRSQRFWGWLGAVPHWLYPAMLRDHPAAWSQVVIWTSLAGSLLAVTGVYLGFARMRPRGAHGAWASPYRGIMYWHHIPGIVFGAFVLMWVVSGLLSMNPWGLMEGGDLRADRRALSGATPTLQQIRSLIEAVPRNSPSGVVSIRSAPLDGELYAISTSAEGARMRFAFDGSAAPLTDADIDRAAQRLVGTANPVKWARLAAEDAYHYSVGDDAASLPAVRVESAAPPGVLYYLDAVTGELIDKADSGGRAYRWWHSGLHRLDFAPALRTFFARTALMLPLLLGAAAVCILGAYLGIRRVSMSGPRL